MRDSRSADMPASSGFVHSWALDGTARLANKSRLIHILMGRMAANELMLESTWRLSSTG